MFVFNMVFFSLSYLCSVREWLGKMLKQLLLSELQDRLPQRMCSREGRLMQTPTQSVQITASAAWQCQLGVSRYNLFLETKSSACIIQAVQRETLKMATKGLEDETWSSLLCYLIWV